MTKQLTKALVLVALFGLLLWVALVWEPSSDEDSPHQTLPLAEAPVGGDFTLISQDGPVSLSDFRGKVVLLYFGYTWCPDICPTSLGYLSAALSGLSDRELEQVQGIFVSVDPDRDSVQRLKEYAEYFHPGILGVTGDKATLAEVAGRYGAAYRIVKQQSEVDYVVDHSADTYLIDPQGRLAGLLPHGTPPEEILARIRALLPDSTAPENSAH